MISVELIANVVGISTFIIILGFAFQEYIRQMMRGET